jgi:hypothetical protein
MNVLVSRRTDSLSDLSFGPTVAKSLGVATLGGAAMAGLIQLKRATAAKPSPHARLQPDAVVLVRPSIKLRIFENSERPIMAGLRLIVAPRCRQL